MRRLNSSLKSAFRPTKKIIEEFCDQMDDKIKELIPLKKIWVVNNGEE